MKQRLKLAGVFSSKVNEVKIITAENKKHLQIFSMDQSLGENNCKLPARIQGEGRDLAFNWRFLADGLRAIKTEEVFFGLNEDNKPAMIKSPNDTSYFYVLMPILKA